MRKWTFQLIERRKSKLLHNYQQSLGGQLEDDDEFIKDLLPNREDWDNFTEAEPPEWTKFKTNVSAEHNCIAFF